MIEFTPMTALLNHLLALGWSTVTHPVAEVYAVSPDGEHQVVFDDGGELGCTWELVKLADRDDDDGVARAYWKTVAAGETVVHFPLRVFITRNP